MWTFRDLLARAECLLAALGIGSGSGRVRAIPDERTLRYYTTIGLLPRPAALKGRTACYTRIHLAHIVAIKRLQALGMSLAQVQAELAGATPGEIEVMAALPAKLPEPVQPPQPAPSRRAFWAEPPAARRPLPAMRAGVWMEVAAGVVVLLPADAMPSGEALRALRQAALPLAEALARQGLSPLQDPTGDDHA